MEKLEGKKGFFKLVGIFVALPRRSKGWVSNILKLKEQPSTSKG